MHNSVGHLSDALKYSSLVESGRLDRCDADILRRLSLVVERACTKAYLVGGMVRDLVADKGLVITSPDFTIIGDAAEFANEVLSQYQDAEPVSVSQHSTAKIRLGTRSVDIASARTDSYEPWGSLPKITLVDQIELDLSRRDFTVNAMAMPIFSDGLGELIDPFEGATDLRNGTLRIISNDSFHEDPLRMMRGIRLAARYGYRFEDRTASLMSDALPDQRAMVEKSPSRVFNEFRLWFAEHENLGTLLNLAVQHGLLDALDIAPQLRSDTLQGIPISADDLVRFAAFAYIVPPETMISLAGRLAMPSLWQDVINEVGIVREVARRCSKDRVSDVDLYNILQPVRDEVVFAAIAVESEEAVTERLQDFRERLLHIRPSLNGDDLISLGVAQGPKVGRLLDELRARRIDGTISDVSEERRYVLKQLGDD